MANQDLIFLEIASLEDLRIQIMPTNLTSILLFTLDTRERQVDNLKNLRSSYQQRGIDKTVSEKNRSQQFHVKMQKLHN